MLVVNNRFALFQLPVNLLKTKKYARYFRGNTQFPIYFAQIMFFTDKVIKREKDQ
jgi:hypothetical protein